MKKSNTYHHDNLKEQLIDLAYKHVNKNGPTKLSLRGIAKAACVSHNAPYRHFVDKTELLIYLVRKGFSELTGKMQKVIDQNSHDPVAQLMNAGIAYVEFSLKKPHIFELMYGHIIPHQRLNTDLFEEANSTFELLKSIITFGQKKKIFRHSGDTQIMTLSAWSIVHGIAQLLSTKKFSQVEGLDNSHEIIVETLGKNLLLGLTSDRGLISVAINKFKL